AGGKGAGHGGGQEHDDRTEQGALEAGRATLDRGVPEELPDPAEEERRFDDLERQLREAIAADPELQGLEANLVIDRTEEGLRIQIVDQEERSMFPRGSAEMYPFMAKLLGQVAQVMKSTTNKVSIGGYTDSTAFRSTSGNDNWSLSAMRANAARRALVAAGLDEGRLARVMGKADTDPFDPSDPTAAVNRRIGIVLLYTHGPRPELGTPPVQPPRTLPTPGSTVDNWQP
ncbi:MAG: OmpA family protein, partial [Pseudomonadota bacterium]